MTVTAVKEFTYVPNGVKVTVLSTHDDGEYYMVRSITTGKVFYAHKNQIVEKDVEEELDEKPVKRRRGRQIVRPESPAFTRININSAPPELLTQILNGVGMKTAVAIKELQQSLPGERFTKLDQLKSISGIDWDVVLEGDIAYVE
jgi:DNA uptake protein ComE-like DNA-binding protein